MTAAAYPQLMSLEQWRALPETTSRRVELQEGVAIVSPRPRRAHARVISQLCTQLNAQLPEGWEALPEVEVVVDPATPATVRVPDVVVCRVDAPEELTVADVALVIEVVSPGSRRTDHVTKRSEYADAGIAQYWIVDLEAPATITTLTLTPHGYAGQQSAGEVTATLAEQFSITVTLEK